MPRNGYDFASGALGSFETFGKFQGDNYQRTSGGIAGFIRSI
jgi:hypothetical protein